MGVKFPGKKRYVTLEWPHIFFKNQKNFFLSMILVLHIINAVVTWLHIVRHSFSEMLMKLGLFNEVFWQVAEFVSASGKQS